MRPTSQELAPTEQQHRLTGYTPQLRFYLNRSSDSNFLRRLSPAEGEVQSIHGVPLLHVSQRRACLLASGLWEGRAVVALLVGLECVRDSSYVSDS